MVPLRWAWGALALAWAFACNAQPTIADMAGHKLFTLTNTVSFALPHCLPAQRDAVQKALDQLTRAHGAPIAKARADFERTTAQAGPDALAKYRKELADRAAELAGKGAPGKMCEGLADGLTGLAKRPWQQILQAELDQQMDQMESRLGISCRSLPNRLAVLAREFLAVRETLAAGQSNDHATKVFAAAEGQQEVADICRRMQANVKREQLVLEGDFVTLGDTAGAIADAASPATRRTTAAEAVPRATERVNRLLKTP